VDVYLLDAIRSRFNFNLGIRYEHFYYDSFLFASEKDFLAVEPKGFLNYYVNGRYETMNNKYYPTRGSSFHVEAILYTDNGYGHEGGPPFGAVSYNFSSALSATERITFIPAVFGRTLIGNRVAYAYLNYMGGEEEGRYMDQQFPFVGINNVENFRRSLLGVSLELRQRLFMRNYLSLKGAYAMNNNDFIDMFRNRNDVWGVGVKYSYDSPIGPISLQIDHSNVSRGVNVYFSLGKSF
jgi:NTE family protein